MTLTQLALPIAIAVFGSLAAAQDTGRIAPIPTPVRDAGTYHLATGEWTRVHSYANSSLASIYRNDIPSGYFGLLDEGEVAFEAGRVPGFSNQVGNGSGDVGSDDSYLIDGFQFGYCALNQAPTSFTISFSQKYSPCGDPAVEFNELASITATGLPSGGCWLVTLDISGTTLAFSLEAEGADGYDGPGQEDADSFGYSLNIDNGQGDGVNQLTSGLILAGSSLQADWGRGTAFDQLTPETPGIGSGINTQDLFWLTSPTFVDGCAFFGGCLPCASFDLTIFGNSFGDGLTCYCDPAGANSVSPEGATLSGISIGGPAETWTLSNIPLQPGILYTGPNQIQLPFGCGDRCVGGSGVVRYGPFFPAATTDSFTIDMTGDPNSNIQYWYRDPANLGSCGAPFNLSNGVGQ